MRYPQGTCHSEDIVGVEVLSGDPSLRFQSGRACPLSPGTSDVNLFRYCQGVIDLDAEIPDGAFDLGMPEQELDSPEIARPSIDQGSFRASQRMGPRQDTHHSFWGS